MTDNNVFLRREYKYVLSPMQYAAVIGEITKRTDKDIYGESAVQSLYYDTPKFLLIRRSIERPVYKEKLRVRSYGLASNGSPVFVELKKKYDGVVYKRRIVLSLNGARKFLSSDDRSVKGQIADEIRYFISFYGELRPSILLIYDRVALYDKEDKSVRITFDKNLRYRTCDLTLDKNLNGRRILDEGYVLMEIKAGEAIPLWLVRLLSTNKIYKRSFSKCGEAYKAAYGEEKAEVKYVG